ncbi:MAG: hypothetical protein UT86_C0004G0092 [Candidatus Magasanikbacteria bacterium GW2011_GWC2_40_17]|uniref:Glycosyltransferase RgtA/B/C/D-like domain-containing protein n=1 Tax=Candidatus Magasanikbacteria bacterium GW2011_GWA2_42_32 TaxID=1619039 RepID=A0A0G1A7Y6_9BACT|nr:MAG: hypothetical protein UT86_C0004G0092 [Candidatus Magasanikbacteria bacterium GW2011_GWC2_40_17]KKS57150.1 MAG: hypothetical protein UV20_C0003G0092 [Candidatus Magasanikbacteria bacterium GW2011_GWA2_42_32]OGH85329.1 MAG: hypothetical protein A2294_00985 [Candidatus Magasanikbacteria bacterium RIFOXYB2_FULL_38_10]
MKRQEWIFISIISGLLIIITAVPYLYGWLMTPPNYSFLGNGFFNSHDNHVYYAYIEQVKAGHFLLKDVFTSETQKPFLNIFWLLAGLLASFFHLGPIFTLHFLRIILIPLFVIIAYKFALLAYENDAKKELKIRLAILFLFFTAGFGGLICLFNKNFSSPLEVWWPEAYAFLSSYFSPHFIASWTLLLLSFYFLIKGLKENSYKKICYAGLFGLFLIQFHTFYLALIAPVSLIFLIYSKNLIKDAVKKIILYNLFFVPAVAYYFFMIASDEVMGQRLFNNLMLTPNSPTKIILAFGLIIPLAIIAFLNLLKEKNNLAKIFLNIWFISVPFLILSKLPFERRLIEGWQFPAIILAVDSIFLIKNKFAPFKKISALIFNRLTFFLIFIFPLIFIYFILFNVYYNPGERQFYLPNEVKDSLVWLKNKGTYDDIVLSSTYTGLAAAFMADKTVFIGHGFETLDSRKKMKQMAWFFQTNTEDDLKKEMLKNWNIKYLIFGPYEKALNSIYEPDQKKYLTKIYSQKGVEIYQTAN